MSPMCHNPIFPFMCNKHVYKHSPPHPSLKRSGWRKRGGGERHSFLTICMPNMYSWLNTHNHKSRDKKMKHGNLPGGGTSC